MSEYWVTGNEFVSLPTIRQGDGAIEGLSFLHMGAKGMIELRGGEGGPLIAPFVELDGRPVELEGLKWGRLHSWVPRFEAGCGGCRLEGTLLAPIGERGFGYHLRLSAGEAGAEYALGLRGCWAEALHSVNESKAIEAEKHAYRSAWNHSFVLDMRPGLSLFAFAPIFTEDPANCPVRDRFCMCGDEVRYSIELPGRLAAGESAELCVWFGLGFEEVSAATSAKEMLRQGYGAELRKTLDWLAQRERTVGSSSEALAASSMNAALSGGSSSSLSMAFCVDGFMVSASWKIYTFLAASLGMTWASATTARTWSTVMPRFLRPSASSAGAMETMSGCMPARLLRQERQRPQGRSPAPSQSRAAARPRAARSRSSPEGEAAI